MCLFSLLWSTSWSSIFSSSSSGSRRAGAFPATRGGVHLRQVLISRLQRARLSFCMFKELKYFDTVCVRHSSSIPAHKNHVKTHFHYFMWCHYLCSINVSVVLPNLQMVNISFARATITTSGRFHPTKAESISWLIITHLTELEESITKKKAFVIGLLLGGFLTVIFYYSSASHRPNNWINNWEYNMPIGNTCILYLILLLHSKE